MYKVKLSLQQALSRLRNGQPVFKSFPDHSCIVDAPPVPRAMARAAAVDPAIFRDPNYRGRKVVNLFVEVDSIYAGFYGTNTEATVRSRFALISKMMEQLYGFRVNVQTIKINTTPDSLESITAATPLLYQWSSQASINTRPEQFKFRISGRNMGGSAYTSYGAVTSAKYAVCGFGRVAAGTEARPGLDEYGWLHEILHNLGIGHSHNCCIWKDATGKPLGRLDECWQGEKTCSPAPEPCGITTRRMEAGINSYGHRWGTQNWWLNPVCVPVLHEALYYSDLPSYEPAPVERKLNFTVSVSGTRHSGFESAINDGDDTTRFVFAGPGVVRCDLGANYTVTFIRLKTGFWNGSSWGSAVRSFQIWLNNNLKKTTTGNTSDVVDVPLVFSATTVEIRLNDIDFNRIREIEIWGY